MIFNLLNIKIIKVTFYDWKVAVPGKKMANCRKCTKQHLAVHRIDRLEFWKILPVRLHFPFTLTSPPAPISRTCRRRRDEVETRHGTSPLVIDHERLGYRYFTIMVLIISSSSCTCWGESVVRTQVTMKFFCINTTISPWISMPSTVAV